MPESDVEAALERQGKLHFRSFLVRDRPRCYGCGKAWPCDHAIIEAHIEAQAGEIARLRGLLREHEWCQRSADREERRRHCAKCFRHKGDGHTPDCPMGLALAPKEGTT